MKNKLLVTLMMMTAVLMLAACQPVAGAGGIPPVPATDLPQQASTEVPAVPVEGSTDATTGTTTQSDCQVISNEPDPNYVQTFKVLDEDWIMGNENAKVTLIVYTDIQCPACAQIEPLIEKFYQQYPKDVRIVVRHFPLPMHEKAIITAQAVEAAGKQGYQKFFELKNFLFAEQQNWTDLDDDEFETWLMDNIGQFGLDADLFNKDWKSEEIVKKVQRAQDKAVEIGINYTPFILYNYDVFKPVNYSSFEGLIGLTDFKDKIYKECPPNVIDASKSYTATLKTSKGDVVLELLSDAAPVTVNSFVFLAQNDWFDSIIFHRVIPGFVAQSGDPSGTGMGYPGYTYDNEISIDLKYDAPGMVGMANSGANTNGSQFFITYDALPQLDGQYTIFAKVIEGMAVVESLTERIPEAGGDLPPGDIIQDVVIEAK